MPSATGFVKPAGAPSTDSLHLICGSTAGLRRRLPISAAPDPHSQSSA